MKTKELIRQLQQLDPEMEVYTTNHETGKFEKVEDILLDKFPLFDITVAVIR